uniref:Potassium large conductance calcium-activated channel, subfamily M, beta member 2a n=1 Tax=Erpetoichthys calabaricus TaxID=27687 RepID=A0A8C4SIX2_ERPCA
MRTNPRHRMSPLKKIRQYELLDKKKTVTALKAGEDRAILLGLAMIALSMMMYFLLGITMIRSYKDSVWKGESRCSLFNLSIIGDRNCTYSCGTDCLKVSKYPCLRVYVNLTEALNDQLVGLCKITINIDIITV